MSDEDPQLEEFSRCLKALSVQILRTVRGAGKPHEIVGLAVDMVVAHENYRKLAGMGVSSGIITNTLRLIGNPHFDMKQPICLDMIANAQRVITEGALQLAASRLAGQATQAAAGEREIVDGVRLMNEAWAYRKNSG